MVIHYICTIRYINVISIPLDKSNRRSKKKLDNAVRELICQKYDAGKPTCIIATELEIPRKTVASVLMIYKKTGRILTNMSNSGRKKVMGCEDTDFIKGLISEDCSVTLNKIKENLLKVKNIDVSLASIHRAISDFEYSFKKVELIPKARNNTNNIQKRYEYCREIMALNFNDIIYIDEMGVNCSMRTRYGRSLVGTTPRKAITAIRSQNISVCACVTRSMMLHYKVVIGAYNTKLFLEFINELVLKMREKNLENKILIVDNCAIHKNNLIKDVIHHNGHRLIFLPPYTPQLNAIEEVFSLWKSKIKRENCTTREMLLNCIKIKFEEITQENCIAFYSHVQKFLVKGLAREEF